MRLMPVIMHCFWIFPFGDETDVSLIKGCIDDSVFKKTLEHCQDVGFDTAP